MRILLFTGKGGVGKTTVAAATAVRAAAAGRRTLVMSTDPAHSLADSFDIPLTSRAQELAPNLWAEQIDAQERLELNWRDIQEHRPRYSLFGHVHQPLVARGAIGSTELVNVGHFQAHGRGFTLDVPD